MNWDDQLYNIRPANTCLFADRTNLNSVAGHGGNWKCLVPAFVPRLVGGRHKFNVSVVAVHGWLGGCRQYRKLRRNVLGNAMLRRSLCVKQTTVQQAERRPLGNMRF